MNGNITYSVVIPVYNSESSLEELCARIISTLSQFTIEIILVDDGSTDKSWQKIEQLKSGDPEVIRAIQLRRNYGQHAAILCAFSFCKGQFVITIDDDLQYDPTDILLLIQKQKETDADIVYGVTNKKNQSPIRNFSRNYIEIASRMLDGQKFRGSSFRLINKKIIPLIAEHHSSSFISLDTILSWYTSSYSFIKVAHYPRLSGKSGYSFLMIVKMYLNTLMNYSDFMLKTMIYSGFTFSFISFLIGLRFIYRKIIYDVPVGYTSIIVAILFCSSIIMLCLGIIGQYLYRAYIDNQKKPLYSIKHII